RQHWAFQPIANPKPPQVKNAAWVKEDLDRFILAKQEAAGVKSAPDADRFTLIRRVSLDLAGLPPTPEEVAAFVNDPAPDDEAYAKVVDRLLASARFGERWGRHWLDVVRYADSVGRTRNVPFPYAWRYRNYVIDAFNADKPFDRFLTEQLAGDLLPAGNPAQTEEQLVATGFLALGSMDLNERDTEQFRLDRIDDQVDTLGRSVMALTAGCARCHDHKFDPLEQRDYYALAGIFASTRTLSGQKNKGGGNKNYFDSSLLVSIDPKKSAEAAEARASENRENAASRRQIAELREKIAKLSRQARNDPKSAKNLRQEIATSRQRLAQLEKSAGDSPSRPAQKKKKNQPGEKVDLDAPLAMAAVDGEIENLALRVRGEPDMKGDVIPRGFPAVLCAKSEASTAAAALPEDASGRLELAKWLTDPAHPLTARVMANRVWSHLFGRGIVPTVDNFGAMGEAPTHPELLDHLASRFVAGGWSVKGLVRDIVLSHTYRLGSEAVEASVAADEANTLYWRMNLRRLEAETIRDSLLLSAGRLDTDRPEGAPFDQAAAAELGKNAGKRGKASDPVASAVRSVYLPVFRSKLPGMFTVFDFAEPDQVNGHRDVTTVAPQALFMLNNEFVIDCADRAADRLLARETLKTDADRVVFAYADTLCRKPSAAERENAAAFLSAGEDSRQTWSAFLQALYSSAEFRYAR
ncbi:MAG: DUF1549 domain-containing protein, partial [Verrucomicrobiae bacterium]|nr:DUF1549 domain-containing protein [Verrucomicrobiae bacterium]